MVIRKMFNKISNQLLNYNLFLPDEDESSDDPALENSDMDHQQQLYATRLYMVIFIGKSPIESSNND